MVSAQVTALVRRNRDLRHLADKQSKSDTNTTNGRGAVLLDDEHEDGKDQLSRQEELEKECLLHRDTAVQSRRGVEATAWHEGVREASSGQAASNLGNEDNDQTHEIDGTSREHGDSDSRVEHAASNTEEGPMEESSQCLSYAVKFRTNIGEVGLGRAVEAHQTLTIKEVPKAKAM